MIQVRVAQQSAVSVRIAGAAPVRVDVTGTAVVSAPEYMATWSSCAMRITAVVGWRRCTPI